MSLRPCELSSVRRIHEGNRTFFPRENRYGPYAMPDCRRLVRFSLERFSQWCSGISAVTEVVETLLGREFVEHQSQERP